MGLNTIYVEGRFSFAHLCDCIRYTLQVELASHFVRLYTIYVEGRVSFAYLRDCIRYTLKVVLALIALDWLCAI